MSSVLTASSVNARRGVQCETGSDRGANAPTPRLQDEPDPAASLVQGPFGAAGAAMSSRRAGGCGDRRTMKRESTALARRASQAGASLGNARAGEARFPGESTNAMPCVALY